MCCPVPGGYPGWAPLAGVPHHPDLAGGGAVPGWAPPGWATPPHPDLAEGGTLGRFPLAGVPPHPDLAGGTLGGHLPGWGTPQSDLAGVPPVWTWPGYPPPHRCGQTENITFPHPSDAVGNKITESERAGHNAGEIVSSDTLKYSVTFKLGNICPYCPWIIGRSRVTSFELRFLILILVVNTSQKR